MIWLFALLAQEAMPGEKIFAQNCSIGYCHGAGGAASRGPRLRDRSFPAGYVAKVTREGIPRTSMPGFLERLKEDEIVAVVRYVESLAQVVATGGGRGVYLDRCGICHRAGGAGQELSEQTVRAGWSGPPKRVRMVRLKDGETFPAVVVSEDAGFLTTWDVTTAPPVRRTVDRAAVSAIQPGAVWKHPPAEDAVLSDVLEFLGRK
ncbi:MAG: c-type cytochrome [Bryobacteraceae bacterium]